MSQEVLRPRKKLTKKKVVNEELLIHLEVDEEEKNVGDQKKQVESFQEVYDCTIEDKEYKRKRRKPKSQKMTNFKDSKDSMQNLWIDK